VSAFDVQFIDEQNTHRLLSSAYVDEPAIAPLCDDEGEKAILDRLEARTSNRLLGQDGQLDEVDPRELLTETFGYGWSFVNAAFSYTRIGGNRFNREGRGAWYAALAVETCLAEIAFHLGRELKNTGETENVTRYVQLMAHIAGPMACLLQHRDAASLNRDRAGLRGGHPRQGSRRHPLPLGAARRRRMPRGPETLLHQDRDARRVVRAYVEWWRGAGG
jgi:hypothetical protein